MRAAAYRSAPIAHDGLNVMESAVLEAWRRTDFAPETVAALQALARTSRTSLPAQREDAIAVATRWLRAADRLVRDGKPVTWESLAFLAPLVDLSEAAASVGVEPPASPVKIPGAGKRMG